MAQTAQRVGVLGTGTSSDTLRICLLGGFRIELSGEAVPDSAWQRPKAKSLMKLLALSPDHQLHREQVLDLLWPDLDPDAAGRSLRKAVHFARHAVQPQLGPGETSAYLALTHDVLSLHGDAIWIDVDVFEAAARIGRASGSIAELGAATVLYSGELLPEDRFEEWVSTRRDELAQLHLDVLLDLAGALERQGDTQVAITRLQEVLAIDPAQEVAHRGLMRLYAQAGARHQALRQYQACRVALAQQLDVEPEDATEQLYAEIRAGKVALTEASPGSTAFTAIPLPVAVRRDSPGSFVGRERPLGLLLSDPVLQAADISSSPDRRATVFISGEAGVGKTRLVTEAARTASAGGIHVLWGTAYADEGRLPYGPFVEALSRYIESRTAAEREAVAGRYPELRRLLPVLASGQDPPPPGGQGSEQSHLFSAVSRLLDEIATDQPVLLVLDDLHTADTASLALLHHLARQASDHRWLVVGMYREEDVRSGSELQSLLTELNRTGSSRQIDLLRLGRSECDLLVQSLLPEEMVAAGVLERLHTLSLGNPLFVTELIQSARDEDGSILTISTGQAPIASVPEQIRHLIEARAHALGEDVVRTLSLAATAGMEFRYQILARAAQTVWCESQAEELVLDALDAALDARILDERRDGYGFRHPLFREALYARLSAPRRSRLHGALGAATEDLYAEDIEALAYHYARSADREKAARYLREAGNRARDVYANDIAEGHFRRLIELLLSLGREQDSAHIRLELGLVLMNLHRVDDALEQYDQAAEYFRRVGDLEGLGEAIARSASMFLWRDDPEAGIIRIEEMIARLEVESPQASTTLSRLYVALGSLRHETNRYAVALTALRRAWDLARTCDDARACWSALMQLGFVLVAQGYHREARPLLLDAIEQCREHGHLSALAVHLTNLGVVCYLDGTLQEAIGYHRQALDAAQRTGDPAYIGVTTALLGRILFLLGEWKEGRAYVDRGAEILAPLGIGQYDTHVLWSKGAYAYGAGDWDEAARYLEEVRIRTEWRGDLRLHSEAQIFFAEYNLALGRAEEVRRCLESFLARPELLDIHTFPALPYLALAYLDLGDTTHAGDIMRDAVVRCRAAGWIPILTDVLRVHGIVLAASGQVQEAEDAFTQAVSLARRLPYPWLEARILRAHGEASIRRGEIEQARDCLDQAGVIFRRLGARMELERVTVALSGK